MAQHRVTCPKCQRQIRGIQPVAGVLWLSCPVSRCRAYLLVLAPHNETGRLTVVNATKAERVAWDGLSFEDLLSRVAARLRAA